MRSSAALPKLGIRSFELVAVALGHVVAAHPQLVVMRTALGGTRVIPFPRGEEVPRIC